ncbi:hypothetical protein BsIDN1_31860 [Bacillus safensis]|uniref:CarD-like/TRCF RNAP-interacting domain-containing protein n=1 Tax=Bacillus safensis TaxID=561879 RepID=A0A5S9M9L2_BACIA|nr:hypothetical protein BsIDN1_31860 [Bacillus safensis]
MKEWKKKEILGKTQEYFLIQMPNMQMMVPKGRINQLGIRPVADQATLKVVMNNFAEETNDDTLTWKQRYDENLKKLKKKQVRSKMVQTLSKI